MKLKFKYDSRTEIPADLLSFYTETGGVWSLDIDGAPDRAKLDEFRQNNLTLRQELETFRTRFQGIDPDEVRKLSDEKRRLEEAQQLKAGEIEKVIETRVKPIKTALETQIATLATERDTLHGRLTAIQIDQGITTAATKRGLRASAIPDITARARTTFKLVNGVPTALDSDGQTTRPGKDGITPMTIDEWVDAQVSEAPHLFEPNAGTGASAPSGASNPRQTTARNPFRKETWNLTEQMKLQKTDPQLAARLSAAI